MLRVIDGFHQDELGDWVAELSCLHGQHVRHQPPFQERAWVTTASGRAEHIGSPIECPRCDRAELPEGLHLARTAGPFTAETVPAGLRRHHQVAARTWGRLRVTEGSLRFSMATEPAIDRVVAAGDRQPIPPRVPHAVEVSGPVAFAVEFLVADPARATGGPA